ncbi:hypothetical protein EVG20_g7657 [Dentipellis fragilis]|uniref:Uncharacterized protein n=1 Tax=Dentipellis fragilis TaxID=205917 RepID=A0A4Y9YDZ4_9AGAM|nr:hypothetical protein EVG20_g7657 [Dentipellis fragilis]
MEENSDSSSCPNFQETIPVGLAFPPITSIDIASRHHRQFSKSRLALAQRLLPIRLVAHPTITPSLFTRNPAAPQIPPIPPQEPFLSALPPTLEQRPKLFYTSAKTGVGVADVPQYVARRVVMRSEWEEAVKARMLHLLEESGSTIRLGDGQRMRAEGR